MNFILKKSLFLLLMYAAISCVSSRKMNFSSAYKFGSYNYHKSGYESMIDTSSRHQIDRFSASLEPALGGRGDVSYSALEENLIQKINLDHIELQGMGIDEIKENITSLSPKEKRAIRKDLRREVKKFKKEIKDPAATMDINRVQEISELLRWAIILGSVGLVLLILGAIFTSILTFFGAILVVGAAVLLILDQV